MSKKIRTTAITLAAAFIVALGVSTAASAQGLALFNAKCVMCHGAEGAGGFAHRSIRGATASRIQKGINMRPDMAFLSYLSQAEINRLRPISARCPPASVFRATAIPSPARRSSGRRARTATRSAAARALVRT